MQANEIVLRSIFRHLPDFKGKRRLVRFYYKRLIKQRVPVSVKAAFGLSFCLPNLLETVAFEIIVNGDYERPLVDYLTKEIPQGGVFYDIGANIGAISVLVAKCRPDVTVYSFEASRRVYHYLEKNIRINSLHNVKAYNIAIDIEDNVKRSFYSPEDKFGKGSFSPVFTDKAEEVLTIRLDTFFASHHSPDILKVDVEGFEKIIFESMGTTLNSEKRPEIVFEFVDWAETLALGQAGAAQKYLFKNGYQLYDFERLSVFGELKKINISEKGSYNILAKPHT